MTVSISGTGGVTFNDNSVQDTAATGFGFKNRIINGAMVIDQRNAGASVAVTDSTYILDRWQTYVSQTGKLSAQQNAGSVTPPAGFVKYLGYTSLSAYTVGASEQFISNQPIEGFNIADFGWGTASASTITLSFWVRSSITGTHSGALRNGAGNRSYVYTFIVNSANTWEYKTVTITGDTSGIWTTTNGYGIAVQFNLGSGASASTTAGAWTAGNFAGATGSVSVVGTSGATFYITGVQLEKGSTATSFDYRPYGTELALCQRYYWVSTKGTYNSVGSGVAVNTSSAHIYIKHPVSMRASPTFAYAGVIYLDSNISQTVSGIGATYSGLDSSRVDFNSVGLTTNAGYILFTDNGVGNFISASAEL